MFLEYFLIEGCDDTGYYFLGPQCVEGIGPREWDKLGMGKEELVEAYHVPQSGEKKAPEVIVKDAFEVALMFAKRYGDWVVEGYHSGTERFDCWADSLVKGIANTHGNSYNAHVWAECRSFVVKFLDEFTPQINGRMKGAAEEALADYRGLQSSWPL